MTALGQKLIDKAKSRLAPRNRWLFDLNGLEYVIKDGKKIKKSIKEGKILFGDDGMQFIDDSKPERGFSIDDYDHLHYLDCQKVKKGYKITINGRKIKTKGKDDQNDQDPMENL